MPKYKPLGMQKIIIDTNVIVSSLISNSFPAYIIYDLIFKNKVEFCLSKDIFSEYIEVLGRSKFDRFKEFKLKAEIVISKIGQISKYYEPKVKIDIIKDISDNKFLELASESFADFLITGNSQDFTITHFESTKIVSPKTYWENFRTN